MIAELAVLGAGDDQQLLGEPDQPVDLVDRRADRRAQLALVACVQQRQLELDLVQRQRRPQLVARVVDEATLALERLPRAAPSISFRVSPRRRQLVVGLRHRQARPRTRARRSPRLGGASRRPGAAPRRRRQ